ncbi:EexN family lipoprotein [Serratia fonticola]|uniref:EexN family lipoprotein n=1 Tax=Serratia fonticola TaxID=47917 RepID=A0ABY9PUS6_SERFO|nr:EexN family lipoprotein [Serratia fonticola]WMT17220.1 EexN family lipoprotein [Serratia fonticola]WMT17229.1 EexN family lipoprotein [Serratia fonticola]
MKLKLLLLITLSISISGCDEEVVKSKQWWIEHPEEAVKKYLECKKLGNDTPNCRNVADVSMYLSKIHEPMKEIAKEEAGKIKKDRGL